MVLAGPNGSGKSSLRRSDGFRRTMREAGDPEVIDRDAIARDLPPELGPEERRRTAGREVARRSDAAFRERRSLLIETLLAAEGKLDMLREAAEAGYRIELHYVCLESADGSLQRVARRVAEGGHDVPEVNVRRYFSRSLDNLPAALAASDSFILYDNSSSTAPHRKVAMSVDSALLVSPGMPEWARIAVDAAQGLRPRPHIHVIDPAEWTP